MPFRPSITATQCCDCTKFTLNDTSDFTTYPKNLFTSRSIKLLDGYGQYYIPQGYTSAVIPWPLNSDALVIPVDQDYAFTVEYTIVPVTPVSGDTYLRNFYIALSCNLRTANENLIKMREIDQVILNVDANRVAMQDISIEYLIAQRRIQQGDIIGSQRALDRGLGIYNDYNQNFSV